MDNVTKVLAEHEAARAVAFAKFDGERQRLTDIMSKANDDMLALNESQNAAFDELNAALAKAMAAAREADLAEEDKARSEGAAPAAPVAGEQSAAKASVGSTIKAFFVKP